MLQICFRRAWGPLLGLLLLTLPGWGFAQEFATDRLYIRQHGKARCLRDVKEYVVASLDQRRAEISGVNVDEELVEMMRFEQSFAAASRYIQVINDLNDSLLALI